METEDTPPEDNRTEPGDICQGMETEETGETDENAIENMEGNDTDDTIDYTHGVEVEIKTEYESGRHICFRGDLTWVFKSFFSETKLRKYWHIGDLQQILIF